MRVMLAACLLTAQFLGSSRAADTPLNFCGTQHSGAAFLQNIRATQVNPTRTRGLKKILVARPTFSNDAADPFPPEHRTVLQHVQQFFHDSSYGTLDLVFTVSPLVPIAQDKEYYRFRN